MSEHDERGHHRKHISESQKERGPTPPFWRRAHRDWRVWVAVALMLVGMILYLMTMDESLQPGGKVNEPVPAAPGL
jgi:hypothetical protein